jgi:protocatechuate 3,4-dioxygenase beta subunit
VKTLSLTLALLLIPNFSWAQAPKGTPPPKTEECKVVGMVVKLAGSEPLRKARVQLQSADEPTRTTSTLTDSSGRFQLKTIEPGRYKIFVSRTGFVSQEYGQRKPDDPGAILTLRPGQEVKDLLFRLVPSGVIAGRVLDEDGEPLASVTVSALREVYNEGKRTLATSSAVSTDDRGDYRLFGLAPGRYFVTAVYPHWGRYGGTGDASDSTDPQQQGYAKVFYPGTPDAAKAMSIVIKAGEEAPSIDILMRRVSVYHVRGHVYNQITHKTGTETNVMLMPKRSGREWEYSDQQAIVERKDGAFTISEVLPGSYVLLAFWFDEGKTFSTRMPVDVGNADVDGITLTIGAGVNISGRVMWDGTPSVQGNDLWVSLKPTDAGWNFGGGGARVDSGNSFSLRDISDGTYFAQINGESQDCYIKDVHYGATDALDNGFTVTKGALATLEIAISSRGARVQGAVVDADRLPAAGVQVVIVPEESRRALYRLYRTGTTDQYGHFEIHGVAPGDYKLFSWAEVESGAWEDPEFLKLYEEKGEMISVEAGDQKTINLSAIPTKAKN